LVISISIKICTFPISPGIIRPILNLILQEIYKKKYAFDLNFSLNPLFQRKKKIAKEENIKYEI
jgi:hypothetical protein